MDKRYKMTELMEKFLPYLKPYYPILFLDLLCAALSSLCDIVLPVLVRTLTNTALESLELVTVSLVLRLVALYTLLKLVDVAAAYYMTYVGHVMGAKIETDMRKAAYAHLQKLSHTFFSNNKVGQIMGRITNDLFDVTEFAHHCPEEFFIAGLKIVVSFVVLLGINVPLTLLVFVFVPFMIFFALKINGWINEIFARRRIQIGELNAKTEDSLLGQSVVKAFTAEDFEEQKFEKDNRQFYEIKKHSYWAMGMLGISNRTFDGFMYLTVIAGGGWLLIHRQLMAGDMVAYVMYISTLTNTIRRIIDFTDLFQQGITGIERFCQIMDAEIEIFDEPGAVCYTNPKGDIEFKDVSFEYPDDHNQVFRHLTLHVEPGEKVALVGPSGGGKTTLCSLLPRFYDATSGEILLDGKDIRQYTLKSLRQNIGIVQQDVYLFSGTVYDNIAYGSPDASKEQVIAAAKRAGAHAFISRLKNGYDTYIGERGVKLSGGQKQRISIARIFLKNPPILLLDEATSALDNESEYEVSKSLDKLSEGRTSITIAHRLSSIRNADRILVLTTEGICEEGTHQELIAAKGVYHRLYQLMEEMR